MLLTSSSTTVPSQRHRQGATRPCISPCASDYGLDLRTKDTSTRIVKSLLAHKADPNIRLVQEHPATTGNEVSLGGATALILAAEVNNYDVVKALLEAGADPKMTTDAGHNALHM